MLNLISIAFLLVNDEFDPRRFGVPAITQPFRIKEPET